MSSQATIQHNYSRRRTHCRDVDKVAIPSHNPFQMNTEISAARSPGMMTLDLNILEPSPPSDSAALHLFDFNSFEPLYSDDQSPFSYATPKADTFPTNVCGDKTNDGTNLWGSSSMNGSVLDDFDSITQSSQGDGAYQFSLEDDHGDLHSSVESFTSVGTNVSKNLEPTLSIRKVGDIDRVRSKHHSLKKTIEPRNLHSSLKVRITKNNSTSRKKLRKGNSHLLVAQDHLGKLKKELRSHTFNSVSKASYSFQHKYSLLVNRLEMLIDSQMFGDAGEAAFTASSGSMDPLCFSEHETTTTSDCASDCQMMDVPTPNYHALPEEMTDQVRTQDEASVDHETPRASRVSRPLYQCTFKDCNFSSHKKADWKRHEESEKHWQQHRYMCILCNVTTIDDTHSSCNFCHEIHVDITAHALCCEAARADGKTFAAARRHHFADHLRSDHGMAMITAEAALWMFPYDSNWPKQCGFCGVIFSNWEERINHVSNHFQEGTVISSWKLPFFKPRQSGDRRPGFTPWNDDDNDEDDDDNTPGGKRKYRASYSYGRRSASSLPNHDYNLGLTDLDYQATAPGNNSKRVQKHPATFQCSLCPKRFTRAYNIRSHLRIHERPFVCTVCGNAFARYADLQRHKIYQHAQTLGSFKSCSILGCYRKHGIRTRLPSSLYKPLAASQIRLLTVLPGSTLDPIQCQLTIGNSQTLPPYEALSYTWGSSGPQSQILCNNEVIDVTGDLSRTLQTLRYSDKERVLWIDAICVDHTSAFERHHQVLLMKEIYMNASHVVVLLSKTDTDRFQTLGVVGNHEMMKRYLEDNDFATIQVLKTTANTRSFSKSDWGQTYDVSYPLPFHDIFQTRVNNWSYQPNVMTPGLKFIHDFQFEICLDIAGTYRFHIDNQWSHILNLLLRSRWDEDELINTPFYLSLPRRIKARPGISELKLPVLDSCLILPCTLDLLLFSRSNISTAFKIHPAATASTEVWLTIAGQAGNLDCVQILLKNSSNVILTSEISLRRIGTAGNYILLEISHLDSLSDAETTSISYTSNAMKIYHFDHDIHDMI